VYKLCKRPRHIETNVSVFNHTTDIYVCARSMFGNSFVANNDDGNYGFLF